MRLLICGDRHWNDYSLVKSEIEDFIQHVDNIECIIEGGAQGADFCAKLVAIELFIPVEEHPAHWDELGKRAGPVRNTKMLTEGKPDFVLAFHDDFENSKGTKNMVDQTIKAGIPHAIIRHEKDWNPNINVIDPPTSKGIPAPYYLPKPSPAPYPPLTSYQPYPGTPRPYRNTKKYYYRSRGQWMATDNGGYTGAIRSEVLPAKPYAITATMGRDSMESAHMLYSKKVFKYLIVPSLRVLVRSWDGLIDPNQTASQRRRWQYRLACRYLPLHNLIKGWLDELR